jgi:hypothetical protein
MSIELVQDLKENFQVAPEKLKKGKEKICSGICTCPEPPDYFDNKTGLWGSRERLAIMDKRLKKMVCFHCRKPLV